MIGLMRGKASVFEEVVDEKFLPCPTCGSDDLDVVGPILERYHVICNNEECPVGGQYRANAVNVFELVDQWNCKISGR